MHWNFFFTLTFVSLFGVIADVPVRYTAPLGIVIIVLYQILLTHFGLEYYIQESPRVDVISKNKEGIFSLFGYTSLYLISSHVGHHILGSNKTAFQWLCYVAELLGLSVLSWVIGYYGMEQYLGIPPSRKMANITYVLYVIAVVLQPLALFILLDLLVLPQNRLLLSTISGQRNSQLVVFLLANLLTGFVNLVVPTLFVSDVLSFLILTGYMFAVCAVPHVIVNLRKSLLSRRKAKP